MVDVIAGAASGLIVGIVAGGATFGLIGYAAGSSSRDERWLDWRISRSNGWF